MLQWCEIPHGSVTLSSIVGADEDFGEVTEQVDNFVMSKYPVTNAQFNIFAQAQTDTRIRAGGAFRACAALGSNWARHRHIRFSVDTLPAGKR